MRAAQAVLRFRTIFMTVAVTSFENGPVQGATKAQSRQSRPTAGVGAWLPAPEERERIESAASASGLSVSAFMVSAAVGRADEVIAAMTSTAVPADSNATTSIPYPAMRDGSC